MSIEKIISGGQTGADQGGLWAARICSIPTGGWAPKGYKTEDGPAPFLRDLFGLKEARSAHYNERTHLNVQDSDGTLLFMFEKSVGSLLTQRVCWKLKKPVITLNREETEKLFVADVWFWLTDNNIKILNVAGNRESVAPGIELLVQQFLIKMITEREN